MSNKNPSDELFKAQQHLKLLRSEYVQLQSRHTHLERAHNLLKAQLGRENWNLEDVVSFPSKIMEYVALLHDQDTHSDIKIVMKDKVANAHKFVLAARSIIWENLTADSLDWSHLEPKISRALHKWIYTDNFELSSDDELLQLMSHSKSFNLNDLTNKCEESLLSSVNESNCIKFYATADEIEAGKLKQHCFSLLSSNWNQYSAEDFSSVNATVLYKLLKSKSAWPLHSAIRLKREDVVFLFLIEFNQELNVKVNETDDRSQLPLEIALFHSQWDLATQLLEHKANVNQQNEGVSLLQISITKENDDAALFLLRNGADPNPSTISYFDSPLHCTAKSEKMIKVGQVLLDKGAKVNLQNEQKMTPLHIAVIQSNVPMFNALALKNPLPNITCFEGFPSIWYALKNVDSESGFFFCEELIKLGVDVSMVCGNEGNSLLHHCALNKMENAAIFLIDQNCNVDLVNRDGETPLHLAAENDCLKVIQKLLKSGANPNVQTIRRETQADIVFLETPLHLAIKHNRPEIAFALIDWKGEEETKLDLKNSKSQSPLSLCLLNGLQDTATALIRGGANVNELHNHTGLNLLHSAILENDTDGALFLIDHGADIEQKTRSGQTPLDMAIDQNSIEVVEILCRKGANLSSYSTVNPPLWTALMKNEDLASVLIRHGADSDGWAEGPDGCQQTLLHRAIDENNEEAACFLIRGGCDINSPRRPGPDGSGGEESRDLASPLHLCCQWGLEETAKELLDHGALINAKDVDDKTPLHVLIENGHKNLIKYFLSTATSSNLDLTIRDRSGLTVFATAMNFKNNEAAKAILTLEPMAAEFYDSRGRNFLHTAILKDDFESVLFLISINVDTNSRTQDANRLPPLFLAVQVGNELIVRNLILAGSSVDSRNAMEQTALHLAAETNMHSVCSILLSNDIDYSAVDQNGDNALHVAMKAGNLESVQVLLSESKIDTLAVNKKGRNPLHVLSVFGKENSASIFDILISLIPNYPVDMPDKEGNTALLLAYMKGNGSLCRSLVKSGSFLGTRNNEGVSIFNYQVATKQLLFRLLDSLAEEPRWGEGDNCEECGTKFGITVRKHHCRHCGRLLCSKCSDKDMPILKYNISKPVRVCETCSDVLTNGA